MLQFGDYDENKQHMADHPTEPSPESLLALPIGLACKGSQHPWQNIIESLIRFDRDGRGIQEDVNDDLEGYEEGRDRNESEVGE